MSCARANVATLAAGCFEKIYFLDPTAGEIKSSLKVDAGTHGVRSVSFSPKSDMVAAGCWNGKIHFMDAAAGQIKSSVSGHSHWVYSVAWSPDGTKLASGSKDKTVRIWEAATGKQLWQLKVDGAVYSVEFSPDSATLAASLGGPSNSVLILDTQSGEIKSSLTGHTR